MKPGTPLERLTRELSATIARTSIAYGLIEPKDRIAIAVSGGKDSYGLLHLLLNLRRRLPFEVHFVAVHVSQGQPGTDPAPLRRWLEGIQVPFEIVVQDTYSVVLRHVREGDTACSACARLRRGILYTTAERLGCNKLALGHHREDTLATLMMNLFYCGKIQAMPPKYRTDDGRFDVIRPLSEIAEGHLRTLSSLAGFPIIPCALCSGQEDHKRRKMNALLDDLEKEHPQIKQVMLGALRNVRPTHLWDKTVVRGPRDL
ncbi:MAG: tRNA 2-thiocytidine(32) synthetase TtcA [Deltaproteobacteria bacterium]|nr:tRNA 2-thiocytidine(32) synthetase TtcA [Deltaproteobacteria bacterium]